MLLDVSLTDKIGKTGSASNLRGNDFIASYKASSFEMTRSSLVLYIFALKRTS